MGLALLLSSVHEPPQMTSNDAFGVQIWACCSDLQLHTSFQRAVFVFGGMSGSGGPKPQNMQY